ncbi:MAG TPA: ice-binding family protein [Planctomycetota bacterium]|nr:ice-binding family protein [Planctomycetota bacterium]
MAHSSRKSNAWRIRGGVLVAVGASLAGASLPVLAAGGPSLGAARTFAVLGASNVSSTGFTAVTGDVGVSPGTEITGFPPATVAEGALHAADPAATAAHADAQIAYDFLAGMASIPANNLSDTDLGGRTLAPGVYKFNAAAELTGDLVLDANGDSGALFVFQIGSSFTTASNATVRVIRGTANYDKSNIFWQVGSSATLGSGTAFTGNILAYASITLVTGTTMTGNALALNGAVTLDANTVVSPRTGPVGGTGKPSKGSSTLLPAAGGTDLDASARIKVKFFPERGARNERSWFRGKLKRLDASTEYTVWADDPSTVAEVMVQFGTLTTKRNGKFFLKLDTKFGDEMPFGATLEALSGQVVEIRDSAGIMVLLTGRIPTTTR